MAIIEQERKQYELRIRPAMDLLQRVSASWEKECRKLPDYHPALERQALTELYVRPDRPEVDSNLPFVPMDDEEEKMLARSAGTVPSRSDQSPQ